MCGKKKTKIAIVTGASSGLGREFVLEIGRRYRKLDEIWVIARREERLLELKRQVPIKLRIFAADLIQQAFFTEWKKRLEQERPDIRMLVNCAGFGRHGTVWNSDYEEMVGMIRLNCQVLTEMTLLCLPYLNAGSRVIQIASAAAFVPQPGFAVYSATKSYVLSFSRALRAELSPRKIEVLTVCPGPVATEFFKQEKSYQIPAYKKLFMSKPEKVVKKALKDSEKGKELSIYGISMKAWYLAGKMIPHRFFLHFTSPRRASVCQKKTSKRGLISRHSN